jgi:hypothetical protein
VKKTFEIVYARWTDRRTTDANWSQSLA